MTEEFDFIRDEEENQKKNRPQTGGAGSTLLITPPKIRRKDEIATSGSPKEKVPEVIPGTLTSEVIAEARKLAESKKGLNINDFFTKHQLVGVKLDTLLHGKLKKDGTLL